MCKENTSLPPHVWYLWSPDSQSRHLSSTCMARPWPRGGTQCQMYGMCDCLFSVVLLNKQVWLKPCFQGFVGNKNNTHRAHTNLCSVVNTLKCTLKPVYWNMLCTIPENYCIVFRLLLSVQYYKQRRMCCTVEEHFLFLFETFWVSDPTTAHP